MFKKEIKGEVYNEPDINSEDLQDTIIARGVQVEGEFKSKGNVVIEGVVLGSVKTNNNLSVGEHAKIAASVSASNAYIAGEIQGNVKIKEKLELSPTSHIYGDIEAKVLIVNAGAILNGKCTMANGEPSQIREKTVKKVKTQSDAKEGSQEK